MDHAITVGDVATVMGVVFLFVAFIAGLAIILGIIASGFKH